MMTKTYHAGWLFEADLDGAVGTESKGVRPVLIVSSERHNTLMNSVIAVPCTHQDNKKTWDSHVVLHYPIGTGVAMCEHVREIDKSRLGRCICKLTDENYKEVIDVLTNTIIRKEI